MRTVTSWGQPEKLVASLEAVGVRHGQTVEATLHGVAVDPVGHRGKVHARFCPMARLLFPITDLEVLVDNVLDGPIQGPVHVAAEDVLEPLGGGTASVRARIVSNGSLYVTFIALADVHTARMPRAVHSAAAGV